MTAELADISYCDREPIHIPGSIQPHGAMLIAELQNLTVVHVAGDVARLLGVDPATRQPLAAWIGGPLALKSRTEGATTPAFIGTLESSPVSVDLTAHVSGKFLIVECEPRYERPKSSADLLGTLGRASGALEGTLSLETLCDAAAVEFRNLTQYDRVMVYRFLDDGSGSVVAEDRRPGLHSFLNHHFPASDIPQQARELYVLNRIRVIPDAGYVPMALRPAWTSAEPLDMSNCALRSVSPIHLQYLKNMGVAASASISIVIDSALWGLIACHNETPRTIPPDVRVVCQALGGSLARHIEAREEAETYRERLRLRGFEDEAVKLLSEEGLLEKKITQQLGRLSGMLPSSGFAFVRGDKASTSGVCPAESDLRKLVEWLVEKPVHPIFSTDQFTAHYPAAENFQNIAAGVLSVTISFEEPWLLLWFRAEEVQIINWAGNPHKAVGLTPGEILSPRASFDEWQEAVHGRARSWSSAEIEIVDKLRLDITGVWQGQRLRELNRHLTRTLADKNQLLQQKQFLIGEVNHRVQNSLQLVSGFLSRQARESSDAAYACTIEEARRRISAVSLLHRRLYQGDDVSVTNAGDYIGDLCDNLVVSLGPEWKDHFDLHLDPVMLPIDSVIPLGLLGVELVINISKYAYDGQPGPVEIALSSDRLGLRFTVADKGRGQKSSSPGFGTRMMKALVEQLSGDLMFRNNDPGLRVILIAPTAVRK